MKDANKVLIWILVGFCLFALFLVGGSLLRQYQVKQIQSGPVPKLPS